MNASRPVRAVVVLVATLVVAAAAPVVAGSGLLLRAGEAGRPAAGPGHAAAGMTGAAFVAP